MSRNNASKESSFPPNEEKAEASSQESELFGATGGSPHHGEDWKGNFEEQQAMIGQLREMLKPKEAKAQEKEIEDYATRLAKMKPRLIRGKGRGRIREKEDILKEPKESLPVKSTPVPEPPYSTFQDPISLDSNIAVASAAEKSDSPESRTDVHKEIPSKSPVQSSRSQPEGVTRSKILQLRKQLEENRIKFERQQRENIDKRAAMEDMKERIEKLRMEVEQRDTLIQSLQEVDSSQHIGSNIQHLYQQIMYKDNTILELSEKVNQLESVIHDQQEQMNEKDQIISARTEAVSLITKDKDDKLMHTIQELEDLKISLREMQDNFINREGEWKEKEGFLQSTINEKYKKINVLEENYQRIEGIRFALSAKNAELQEKIVTMQSGFTGLRKDLLEAKQLAEVSAEESDELRKKLNRAESFGQKRLKALEKQLKSLSSGGDYGSKILELENQIAELEEEKGNLQLKLVDFDDLKIQSEKFNESIAEYDNKIEQLNLEIISQISAMTKLEDEKITLVSDLNIKHLNINSLEETVRWQEKELQASKQSKVTLELRLCQVEEERDLALKNQKDLENEHRKAAGAVLDNIVASRNEEYAAELHKCKSLIEEREAFISEMENLFKEKEILIESLEEEREEKVSENQCLISMLAEKENLLSSQSIKLEKHDLVVKGLQEELSSKVNDSKTLLVQNQNCQTEIDSLKEKLKDVEVMISSLRLNIECFERDIEENKRTISLLEASEKALKATIMERDSAANKLQDDISYLNDELTKKDETISSHIIRLEHMDAMLQSREKQILNLESEIADKVRELSQQESKCSKNEKEVENLKKAYIEVEARLQAECNAISCLLSDKENHVRVIEEEAEKKNLALKNSEIMSSKFEQELCNTTRQYDNLLEENTLLSHKLSSLQEKMHELESREGFQNIDVEMLRQGVEEKDKAIEVLKQELIEEQQKLKLNIENCLTLETLRQNLEDKVSELNNLLDSKENHYQQLQAEFQNYITTTEKDNLSSKHSLAEKESEISSLRESITFEASKKDIQSEMPNKIAELEHELYTKNEDIKQLHQQIEAIQVHYAQIISELSASRLESEDYKAQMEELSLRFEQESQKHLEKLNYFRMEKDSEISDLLNEIESKNIVINKYEDETSVWREMVDRAKESEGQSAHLQSQISIYEKQIDELRQTLDEYKTTYENLYAQYEHISQQFTLKEEELQSLRSNTESLTTSSVNLSESHQNRVQTLEEENEHLKKQLEETQQAITRLETSLATQSDTQESPKEGLDEWGTVDLGERSISDQSMSVQRSLMEKDRALTVIQEQLKIALEEVNAASDDKKILQHQMNILEAELTHKEQKISSLKMQIEDFKTQVTDLKTKSLERSGSMSATELVSTVVEEESKMPIPVTADHGQSLATFVQTNQFSESHPDSSSSYFYESSLTEEKSKDFWDNMEKNSSLEGVATSTSQVAPSEPVQSPSGTEASESQVPDESLQELQYKLSWYEENWALWTEHYTLLQTDYQTAQEQIMILNQEIESLKSSDKTPEIDVSEFEKIKEERDSLEQTIISLTEEKTKLEEGMKEFESLQIASINDLTTRFEEQIQQANKEISRLKESETHMNEQQTQIQTLQHQCSILEGKTADLDASAEKAREYEMLYGELQTCVQEAETKREGSKSRVQELELMVQSAESEIARLRFDVEKLTTAGNALEGERNSIQSEAENLKEEVRKTTREREMYEKESDRLQREAASLHARTIELQDLCQRNQGEIEQLRSEIEILEGDNERNRSNYDILESDTNRLRQENEILLHNNQIISAEKESLETEVQRLLNSNSLSTSERDHFRGEMQRLTDVATSAESEISRLRHEVENLRPYSTQYESLEGRYLEVQQRLTDLENERTKKDSDDPQEFQLEEVDWGTEAKMENDHLQRSSSVERNLQELQELKNKVISLEKEKNELNEELQTSKLKNGKMIQKLKAANNKNENLIKEMQKLKMKVGGFSDLDMAMEKEWKSQVAKVENERDEYKIKIDEMEKEKYHMKTQLDVLEMAQEKYIQLKESQDNIIKRLSQRNESLASQIVSMEWKISELEESVDQQQEFSIATGTDVSGNKSITNFGSVFEELKLKIASLEEEIQDLKVERSELQKRNEEMRIRVNELNREKENLTSMMDDLKDAKSKMETNCNSYKTSYLELHTDHETLEENYTKLNKELESVKNEQGTLKAAYDVLYDEYQQLQENRDSVRLELGITIGERDKLQEEVGSLNNQLQALQEEEEEEIIRALQDECADLREQNNSLKDDITRLNESIRQMEENVERSKQSLDQEVDIQDYLRSEIVSKSQQNDSLSTTVSQLEQQLKYMKAELAAMKTKSAQQHQALESLEPENERLKKSLESSKEKNRQLISQVEAADVSLVKLATRGATEEVEGGRFSSLEATELEAALSSLHIRDLRCQQLSLEINKLLEERDGLQLKLSAALRQSQDLTRELSLSQQFPSPQSPTHSLSQKLAELRDLNSSLERKALDNFRSGTLPPSPPTFISHTAPATPTAMRHLDFTVTRENQGASSTLMNWILGKSTPKEVLHV